MSGELHIGKVMHQVSGIVKPWTMTSQLVAQTNAILGIRGSGKTVAATVIAEEMTDAGLPWVAIDPIGVWWGLRAPRADGSGKGLPVVVIGGEHGDLPVERASGAKVAEAVLSSNVPVVIDVSRESKRFWHTFVTDFAMTLLRVRTHVPRHLFIEEAPEFVPQRASHDLTARCKEAVERLIRLGRNAGYGCTIVSQRPATVDKDVLSQCENVLALRTTGPHDRKALKEWIEANATDRGLERFLRDLAKLPSGHGWWWSPSWLNTFERVSIRQRHTFHPGETRVVGQAKPEAVAKMLNIEDLVTKLRSSLAAPQVAVSEVAPQGRSQRGRGPRSLSEHGGAKQPSPAATPAGFDHAPDMIASLKAENAELRGRVKALTGIIEAVRKEMKPEYDALSKVFGSLDQATPGTAVDASKWTLWLDKAGTPDSGRRKMLEHLIQHGQATRRQLCTIAGVSPRSGTNYLAWFNANQLIERDGTMIRLRTE